MKKLLFILVLLLAGCVSTTSGVPVDKAQVAGFKKGITTEAEVVQALGNPSMRSSNSDGTTVLMYFYSQSQARGLVGLGGVVKVDSSSTAFTFDQAGKLISNQTTETQYGSGLPAAPPAAPVATQ